jgi:hypothetical protein
MVKCYSMSGGVFQVERPIGVRRAFSKRLSRVLKNQRPSQKAYLRG